MDKKRGLLIWSFDFNSYWVDLAIRTGLTTLGLHPIPDARPEDPCSLEAFLKSMKTDTFQQNAKVLKEHDIDLEIQIHAMGLLMPHKNYELHPEWFRMDEVGVRRNDLNFCPSNEEALQYVEDQAEQLARQLAPYTWSHRYYIWIDDNGQYCNCSKCRELSPSDQALIIYNRILKGIRRVDPLAKQSYLAYQNTVQVPQKVRPEAGIFLEYAPINRDSGFAIQDTSCFKNVNEAVHIKPLLSFFGTEDSQILEYWMDNSRFYQWKHPFGELPFYAGVLQKDVEFYTDCGFKNLTSFACGLNETYTNQYGEWAITEYGRRVTTI